MLEAIFVIIVLVSLVLGTNKKSKATVIEYREPVYTPSVNELAEESYQNDYEQECRPRIKKKVITEDAAILAWIERREQYELD